ncbi:MAG: hypothetical protein AB7F35_14890 [Acetobacteraceae bacterium]
MRFLPIAVLLAFSVAMTGCTSAQKDKEDLLANSGFRIVPADTPARMASLQRLPAHKFSLQNRNGKVVWIYPDPTFCHCIYVGDELAYDAYRRGLMAKRMAREAEVVSWLNENNAVPYPFPWDEWGPNTYYY